jgi:hypothetical protein
MRKNITIRRKNGGKRRTTQRLPKYASTFRGIQKWYVSMFEKFGWMVLAEAKGYDYKIMTYKKSINNLIRTIEHVMSEYEDHNRIHDLRVLLMNTKVLKECVDKNFK